MHKAGSDPLSAKRFEEGHNLALWPSTDPGTVLCTKCGNVREPAVVWIAPGKVTFLAGVQFTGECLVHTCRRCGYSYSSPTLDQADVS